MPSSVCKLHLSHIRRAVVYPPCEFRPACGQIAAEARPACGQIAAGVVEQAGIRIFFNLGRFFSDFGNPL